MFATEYLHPTATTINILLSSIVHSSSAKFNSILFKQLHKKYFVDGEFYPDRCTYTQQLLACQLDGDAKLAEEVFDTFLYTDMRVTPLMRDTLKSTLGEKEYLYYVSGLTKERREQVERVDADDLALKFPKLIVSSDAKEAVVTLPPALGGKRVYVYVPKTQPYKPPVYDHAPKTTSTKHVGPLYKKKEQPPKQRK